MRLPIYAAAVVRRDSGPAGAGGVTPSQCQCEQRGRGTRTMYVVDERNSHCPGQTIATCDQVTGACNCNAIMPVIRPRHFDYGRAGAPA
jgi:hypothetical protein